MEIFGTAKQPSRRFDISIARNKNIIVEGI